MEEFRATFLWPNDEGSIESLGYEFANAHTEPYRREVWDALCAKMRQDSQGELARLRAELDRLREFTGRLAYAAEAMLRRALYVIRLAGQYFNNPDAYYLDPRKFSAQHKDLFSEWRTVSFAFRDEFGNFPDTIPEARLAEDNDLLSAELAAFRTLLQDAPGLLRRAVDTACDSCPLGTRQCAQHPSPCREDVTALRALAAAIEEAQS